MKNFWEWLESQSNITIDSSAYSKAMDNLAVSAIEDEKERLYQASIFDYPKFLETIQKTLAGYPGLKNFLNALNSKNRNYIFDQQRKAHAWLREQPFDMQKFEQLRRVWTYIDHLEPPGNNGEIEIRRQVENLKRETHQEAEKIKTLIEEAISRIPFWNNSAIKIEINVPTEERNRPLFEKGDSAYIYVGSGEMAPAFSFFQIEGRIEIDDVIEGGDTDFFNSPNLQADYFNLINEIKRPNSTNQGKNLTLYTARPVKDRDTFIDATTLPINIFLTNDYNHAEGLAIDLAGTDKIRDIWKIRMNSKYLTQTLDGPIKYYQVTIDNAPIQSISLISTG